MTDKNIWYLPGPFHRYEDDVKAIAKKAGLIIIDAHVTDDREDEAEEVPRVTLRPEWSGAEPAETDPQKMNVGDLRAWLTAQGIEFDPKAPKGEIQQLIPAS